jgi:hypothetical protein
MGITLSHARPWVVAVFAALTVALLAVVPAQAARATSAVCVTSFTGTFTPGFSVTPGSGTLTTNGQTGSFSCVGKIGGDRVTGTGSVGVDETYTGACLSHVGTGTVRIIVPTTAGTKDIVGALTVRRTALVVRPSVQFSGMRYSGIGISIPMEGNCFVTPLRRARISLVGLMSGA